MLPFSLRRPIQYVNGEVMARRFRQNVLGLESYLSQWKLSVGNIVYRYINTIGGREICLLDLD